MIKVLTIPALAAILLSPGAAVAQQAGASSTNKNSEALQLLKDACQFLAEASSFSITAEVWRDHVDENGQKVQFSRELDMEVKRPGKLHVEIRSGHTERGFWFDGKTLSVLDRKQNLYSATPIEGNIDSAVDRARDEFGIDLPLIDLALSDPYSNATAKVQSSRDFGTAPAMGYTCRHLAFTQENVDWQIWIDEGPQPSSASSSSLTKTSLARLSLRD